MLREAGILTARKQGKQVFYRLDAAESAADIPGVGGCRGVVLRSCQTGICSGHPSRFRASALRGGKSMRCKGTHVPTIEEAIELSGIEALHPGGMSLTCRTGEVAEMRPGLQVLDVSSGRGTQTID